MFFAVEVAVRCTGGRASCDWIELLVKLGNSSADAMMTSGEFD